MTGRFATLALAAVDPRVVAESWCAVLDIAGSIGRPARQRSTEYGVPAPERVSMARSDDGRQALILSVTPLQ